MTGIDLLGAARAEMAALATNCDRFDHAVRDMLADRVEAAIEDGTGERVARVEAAVEIAVENRLAWLAVPVVRHLLVSARTHGFDGRLLERCETLLKRVLDAREIPDPAFVSAATALEREESVAAGTQSSNTGPTAGLVTRPDQDLRAGHVDRGVVGRSGGLGIVGEAKGAVKFFNADKGFGFIAPEDGGRDVFVDISAVKSAGLAGLSKGQAVDFAFIDRDGKMSATKIKIGGFPDPRKARFEAPAPLRLLAEGTATGTVKFFNSTKGYGFIERDDGQPDAFVHITAVERAGMRSLSEGDRVEFKIEVSQKGKREATALSRTERDRDN